MRIVITVIGGLSLLAAIYITVMNWACVIASERNKRKGIDRHHSTVPVVTVLLACFALLMWPYWPGKWTMLIPALDIANLNLLFAPIYLIVHLIRKRGSDRKSQS
jgi:hypothetical protein